MAIRVGVIGCGAAGLSALRHLSARPNLFRCVGIEQSAGVGGTWRYTDMVGIDTNGLPVQTSMYKNLRYDYFLFSFVVIIICYFVANYFKKHIIYSITPENRTP